MSELTTKEFIKAVLPSIGLFFYVYIPFFFGIATVFRYMQFKADNNLSYFWLVHAPNMVQFILSLMILGTAILLACFCYLIHKKK